MLDFTEYFKKNGVKIDNLYYLEDNSSFRFYLKTDDYYSLSDAKPCENYDDLQKIFVNISGENGNFYKYYPIKSRFLYGFFEKKVNKFMLQDAEYQGLEIFRIEDNDKMRNFNKLLKIENKINSIKNFESFK